MGYYPHNPPGPDKFVRSLNINGKQNYIITDYNFWCSNEEDLVNWLVNNTEAGADTQTGMILEFNNEQEELMFILRWGK